MIASTSQSASSSGTKEFAEKNKGVPYAVLGNTGLVVSQIGFGGYRISEFEPDHREALKKALLSGINLIDTSTSFTDGSSERLIGQVMDELTKSGQVKRSQVCVISKVGPIQGSALRHAKSLKENRSLYSDTIEINQELWYSISPEFIQEQITQSLNRLGLDRLDVLLLHNPEYYFKHSASRDQYYARIKKAFEHLEKEVENKRISFYGVSSNTLPEMETKSDFTSATRLLEIANSIGPKNHFSVLELPFNIFESGAAFFKNNQDMTLFEFAKKNKLGVLINRPFNAMFRSRLQRLAPFPSHDSVETKGQLHQFLGRAVELEKKFPGGRTPQGLSWANALRDKLDQIDDVLSWKEVLFTQIYPSINSALQKLEQDKFQWAEEYKAQIIGLLNAVTRDLESLANERSSVLASQLNEMDPSLKTSNTLSQKVLRLYRAMPGVHSVLIGMRRPGYIDDCLQLESPLKPEKALEILQLMQKPK